MDQPQNNQNAGRNNHSGGFTSSTNQNYGDSYRKDGRDSGYYKRFDKERGRGGFGRGRGSDRGGFGRGRDSDRGGFRREWDSKGRGFEGGWNNNRRYNTENRSNYTPDNRQHSNRDDTWSLDKGQGYNQPHSTTSAFNENHGKSSSYVRNGSRSTDKNIEDHKRESSPDRNDRARPKDKQWEDHARDPSPDRSCNVNPTQGAESHGHSQNSSSLGQQQYNQNIHQGHMEIEGNQRYNQDQQQHGHEKYNRNQNYEEKGHHGNWRDQNEEWRPRSGAEKNDVHLSKALSFLLRHGAEKRGYTLMPGGFLYVEDILYYEKNLQDYTLEDIQRVVQCNDKQRFFMEQEKETGAWKIRANQGHTLEVENLDLRPLLSKDEAPMVIHGTYMNSWESIKKTGLSRMKRNHIHFAPGEPGENGVISGMRKTCDVLIYVDLEKALADGFKFFWSANNVILCAGNKDGVIPPAYFADVLQRQPRQRLLLEKTSTESKVPVGGESLVQTKKKKKNKTKGDTGNDDGMKTKPKKEKNDFNEDALEDSGIIFTEEGMDVDPKSVQMSKKVNPPNKWDDEDSACGKKEKNNVADVTVESCEEIIIIDDESISVSAVDYLQEKETVAVYCHQTKDGTSISKIMCVTTDKSYVFNIEKTPDIMNAGKLSDFFNLNQPPVKVFNALDSKLCAVFFEKFEIILDGTQIFDLKVAFDLMIAIGEGNMTDLKKTKYDPECVPTSDDESSINSLCLTYLTGYEYLGPLAKKMKDYKRHLFDMVNANIEKGDLKKLRDRRRKESKTPAVETVNVGKKSKGKKK